MDDLKRKRGAIKGQLTRFRSYLDKFDKESKITFEITSRLEKVDALWDEFNDTQSQIEFLDPRENAERDEFETIFFSLVAEAKEIINKISSSRPPILTPNPTADFRNSPVAFPEQNNIKLPPLHLKEFNGKYSEFTEFKNIFEAIIVNNPSLTDVQRLYYLKSCMKGEAAQLLQSVSVTDSNYDVAWNLLTSRYDNKRVIVNSHIRSIFQLSSLAKESAEGLRSLLDCVQKDVRSLQNLGQDTESWDAFLIFAISSKLDFNTLREWENSLKSTELPKYNDLIIFLNSRCQTLETLNANKPTKNNIGTNERYFSNFSSTAQNKNCPVCKFKSHSIYNCNKFLNMEPKQRFNEIKTSNRCVLCLRDSHTVKDCMIKSLCQFCKRNHSSLLCFANENKNNFNETKKHTLLSTDISNSAESYRKSSSDSNHDNECAPSTSAHSFENAMPFIKNRSITLLSTAILYVCDINNKLVKIRCLLDQGSQSNFLTRELFEKLQLNAFKNYKPIVGINGKSMSTDIKAFACIKSIHNNYDKNVEFLVLDRITGPIPNQTIYNCNLDIPSDIKLADPEFYKAGSIDMLLGAGVYWGLIRDGLVSLGPGKPFLQNTVFGYILGGQLQCGNLAKTEGPNFSGFCTEQEISNKIENFWKVEECGVEKIKTLSDEYCEQHYVENTTRDPSGKFIVKLPFAKDKSLLGRSMQMAIKRFYTIEKRMQLDPKLKDAYVNFMSEYESLNHMSKIDKNEIYSGDHVIYIPHHFVFKNNKIRVVFDFSCKTSTSVSPNNILHVGPVLQDELFSILIRFRKFAVALVADIVKMYRMVLVHPSDRDFQRIVWRDSVTKELSHYRLNTVSYGSSPAAFLAIRSLRECAEEFKEIYPLAYQAILNGFYVDDLSWGADSAKAAKILKQQITEILAKSGFILAKFMSNEPSVIADSDQPTTSIYEISDGSSTKTLGVLWDSKSDKFSFSVSRSDKNETSKITKRYILSRISQIFDPLGVAGPVIVRGKIILQQLWKYSLQWDEQIPESLAQSFLDFENDIQSLNQFNIPRFVFSTKYKNAQLHGFSDSSIQAYGACIYVRTVDEFNNVHVTLLCSKSRVAPLKVISLPRLELLAFVLLNKLMNTVIASLQMDVSEIFYWTDSTIVLSWLSAEPASWKTFIANRVSEIQRTAKTKNWYHVASNDNVADLISRGTTAKFLCESSFWKNGPSWLKLEPDQWPISDKVNQSIKDVPEVRKQMVLTTTVNNDFDIFSKFSSLFKLQCVTAYCLRFCHNANPKNKVKMKGKLSVSEIRGALIFLIRLAQKQSFDDELSALSNKKPIKKSNIVALNPFIDKDDGLIRVGGRLELSKLPYKQKHQIILSQSHPLTKLVINNEHIRLQHAGQQSVLASIRLSYWVLNGRNVVRGVLRKCIRCFRSRPTFIQPIMGNLPEKRVQPTRPFYTCAVDFAGAFNIKDGITRSRKIVKTYLCLFVCFSTKAVHIELAGDLSTECFLNCLKRFMSRRGFVKDIYSDNATNFVGANNKIINIADKISENKLSKYLLENNVNWHFIPPYAPNFGGLHERAIGACKSHLLKIMADKNMHYESFLTVLTQVEAILNSRPLTPLSSDPNDLNPLTPSHFLIGAEMVALPEEDVQDVSTNRLTKYKLIQQCTQHFWTRWHREFLTSLQQRTKNKTSKGSLQVGDMVMIKEDSPPMQWCIGRITRLFPGRDAIARVAEIRTSRGMITRAYSKIAILPLE